MPEFTVWEVYVEFLSRDSGWIRHNHGLYSEYDEAVLKRNDVAEEMDESGLEYEVVIKGRKVNEGDDTIERIKGGSSGSNSVKCRRSRAG